MITVINSGTTKNPNAEKSQKLESHFFLDKFTESYYGKKVRSSRNRC